MVKKRDEFLAKICPADCPFLDRLATGSTVRFCSFAIYADIIEPGRHTRTEINDDGTVNYHIPPNCDVYDKYVNDFEAVKKAKKTYESRDVQLRLHKRHGTELIVTGPRYTRKRKRR